MTTSIVKKHSRADPTLAYLDVEMMFYHVILIEQYGTGEIGGYLLPDQRAEHMRYHAEQAAWWGNMLQKSAVPVWPVLVYAEDGRWVLV